MCKSFEEKEDKQDAKQKYREIKNKETVICPPKCTGKSKLTVFIPKQL